MCVFDQKPMHFEDLPLSSIHVEKLGAKLIVLKATEEGGGAEENPSAHSILKKKKDMFKFCIIQDTNSFKNCHCLKNPYREKKQGSS